VKAKIERVSAWKNGKGFFFVADGKSYYGNGSPKLQAGATFEFDVNPEKTLGDEGAPLASNFKVAQDASAPTGRPQAAAIAGAGATRATNWEHFPQEKAGELTETEHRINRAVALKAAAQLMSGCNTRDGEERAVTRETLLMADDFLAWLEGRSA